MILQKLRKHLKEQNWFAVILEVFIVIMGVTLAYQINLWNENRKDHRATVHILQGLTEEFDLATIEIKADMKARANIARRCQQWENFHWGNG